MINFRKFTLNQLSNYNPDIFISVVDEAKITTLEFLEIGDFLEMTVTKGSENLYLDFNAYQLNEAYEIKINLYTKEAHSELRALIINLIKQS